jgi:hypothetical protein
METAKQRREFIESLMSAYKITLGELAAETGRAPSSVTITLGRVSTSERIFDELEAAAAKIAADRRRQIDSVGPGPRSPAGVEAGRLPAQARPAGQPIDDDEI